MWKDYDDLDSLAKVNECRQQLLEVGADPTISTPNTRSPARVIFSRSRKVIKDYSHSEQRSDPDKDALATLLNHGFEFLASVVDSCHIVNIVIAEQGWTLAGVEFLLQLSGSKLPTQNLTCALGNAIHGSFDADESEWLQVLILLIENGADMTGPGHWVSGVACNPRTWYKMRDMESHEMYDGHNDSILNQDLRLRRIWAKGLAACGYDAEEFISQSKRFEELSETDDEGSEDEALLMPDEELISTAEYNSRSTRFEEMWDTDDEECEEQKDRISDEDNISTAEEPVQPPDLNEEAFDGANGSGANDTSQLSGPIPYNSSDWARLEEDTLIWQD